MSLPLLGSRQVVKALVFGAGTGGGSNPSFPVVSSPVFRAAHFSLCGVLVLVRQNILYSHISGILNIQMLW